MSIPSENITSFYEVAEIAETSEANTKDALVITNDGKILGLPKALIPVGTHNHDGDQLKPERITGSAVTFEIRSANPGNIRIRNMEGTVSLYIYSNNAYLAINGNPIWRCTDGLIQINGGEGAAIQHGMVLPDSSPSGKAQAYAWETYPCTLEKKTNIREISDAVNKVKGVRGLLFTQDGKERAGCVVEELEATGIPEIISKNAAGEVVSKNETLLIPVLLQAVRELVQRVEALERL